MHSYKVQKKVLGKWEDAAVGIDSLVAARSTMDALHSSSPQFPYRISSTVDVGPGWEMLDPHRLVRDGDEVTDQ